MLKRDRVKSRENSAIITLSSIVEHFRAKMENLARLKKSHSNVRIKQLHDVSSQLKSGSSNNVRTLFLKCW